MRTFDIKSAAIASIGPVTYISVTVKPIGVTFCTMVDIGSGHKVSALRVFPRSPIIPNFDREYLANGKSQRYISNGT